MTDDGPAWRFPPPVRVAEDALFLLEDGRAEMARRLLEPLPDMLREALGAAYARGFEQGKAAARPAPMPLPAGGPTKPARRSRYSPARRPARPPSPPSPSWRPSSRRWAWRSTTSAPCSRAGWRRRRVNCAA